MVEKRETYTDQARQLLQLPYDDQLEYLYDSLHELIGCRLKWTTDYSKRTSKR